MEHKRIESLHKFCYIQFIAMKATTEDDDDAVTTVLAINLQYLLVNNKRMIRQYISYRLLKMMIGKISLDVLTQISITICS